MESLSCPFCDFVDQDSYFLLQHVELIHPENGESPFIADSTVNETSNQDHDHRTFYNESRDHSREETPTPRLPSRRDPSPEKPSYVECPYHCGEQVASAELTSHTDLHLAENMAFEDEALGAIEFSTGACNDETAVQNISSHFSTDIHKSLRRETASPTSVTSLKLSLKELLFGGTPRRKPSPISGGGSKRLGRAELGPYAHEKQMPAWLRRMLEDGARVTIQTQIGPNGRLVRVEALANETPNLVPVLARLSHLDTTVQHAVYCSPKVHHICKMPKEGGFCGYRNIQMMISYIREAKATGHTHFPGKTPSILRIQDMIEDAWDMGYNSAGKVETGGIRLTRKYIGTPEAQAFFSSIAIPCEANAFTHHGDVAAHQSLLLSIGEYFCTGQNLDVDQKVHITEKPPIYFQHQGHSLTIVGFEVRSTGSLNLVVFDPMFNPSPVIKQLAGSSTFRVESPDSLLRAHRRGESYLGKYRDFEILKCLES